MVDESNKKICVIGDDKSLQSGVQPSFSFEFLLLLFKSARNLEFVCHGDTYSFYSDGKLLSSDVVEKMYLDFVHGL